MTSSKNHPETLKAEKGEWVAPQIFRMTAHETQSGIVRVLSERTFGGAPTTFGGGS